MTNAVSLAQQASTGVSQGFKNRIINGAMTIDQRNAGASVTATGSPFSVDRWQAIVSQSAKFTIQQNAGSVTPPAGFRNYVGVTSSSAYSVLAGDYFILNQTIEGFNIADLNWGTANAQSITISFWVRSSLTGTFGLALSNQDWNYSYAASYTISSANTWEQKTITITGPTAGTWNSNNSGGVRVQFGLGVGSTYNGSAGSWASAQYLGTTGATSVVGTNGATWYVTGVQLEVGSSATSFETRPYTTELQLCQRYFRLMPPLQGNFLSTGAALWIAGASNAFTNMRATPTGTLVSGASMIHVASLANYNITSINSITDSYVVVFTNSSPGAYIPSHAYQTTTSNGIFLSSEL